MISRKPIKFNLKIDNLKRLEDIFESNKWPKVSDYGSDEFNNFCHMLSALDEKQQSLLLDITKGFLWVGLDRYLRMFIYSYKLMLDDKMLNAKKRIFIVPLLASCDLGKIKSSTSLYYFLKGNLTYLQSITDKLSVSLLDNYESLRSIKMSETDVICLIDDFIGTGETADSAVQYLLSMGYELNNLAIVSLVAQKNGVEALKLKNINVYCSEIRSKGISDLPNADERVEIMDSIEQKLKIKEDYKFGYKGSEALVRMIRTPNNTFPIYWYNGSKSIPVVPFPR